MSSSFNRIKKNIIEAMQSTNNQGTSAYDSVAEVRRVEGDTAWVHIAGGVDETPVKLTMAAKAGDTVQVRVGGGRAWITGNATAPPTDDKTAIAAKGLANIAGNRANTAKAAADTAGKAADAAKKTATNYLTDVNGGGLFVHAEGDDTSGLRISGTSVEIIRNGETKASYGDGVKLYGQRTEGSPTPEVDIGSDHITIRKDINGITFTDTTIGGTGSLFDRLNLEGPPELFRPNFMRLSIHSASMSLYSVTPKTETAYEKAKNVFAIYRTGEVEINGKSLFDHIYPVGSIYMSVDSTSPAYLFGGTWEQISGRFLLAADDGHVAGSTGGEEKHKLTIDELPGHTHGSKSLTGTFRNMQWYNGTSSGIVSQAENKANRTPPNGDKEGATTFTIDATHEHNSVGGNKPHNNMPPYLAVYVWKRTA